MAKFCTKCGNSLPDDAMFCFSCGNKLDAPQPVAEAIPVVEPLTQEESLNDFAVQNVQASVSNESVYSTPFVEQSYAQPEQVKSAFVPVEEPVTKKSRKGLWITLAIVLVLLLSIVAGVVYFVIGYFKDSDEISQKIGDYVNLAYLCDDPNSIKDMIPDIVDLEVPNATVKQHLENRSRAMDQYFGTDVSVKFECDDIEWVNPLSYYYYIDYIENNYDVILDDVDGIYRVYFDVIVEGDNRDAEYTSRMFAIELDDEWYLFNMDTYQFAGQDSYGGYFFDMDEDIGLNSNYYP